MVRLIDNGERWMSSDILSTNVICERMTMEQIISLAERL